MFAPQTSFCVNLSFIPTKLYFLLFDTKKVYCLQSINNLLAFRFSWDSSRKILIPREMNDPSCFHPLCYGLFLVRIILPNVDIKSQLSNTD